MFRVTRVVNKPHRGIAKDWRGKKVDLLTVVEPTNQRDSSGGNVIWRCRCVCGKEILRSTSELSRKPRGLKPVLQSCGCAKSGRRSPHYSGVGDLSGSKWRNIRNSAKRRGYAFTITIQSAWDLFVAQEGKCALTGAPIVLHPSYTGKAGKDLTTASLDRINNKKGYVPGNVHWVHTRINFMKHALTVEEFTHWCIQVASYSLGIVGVAYAAEFGRGKPGTY